MDKWLSLSSSLLNTSDWSGPLRKEIWFKSASPSLPSSALLPLPPSLSVIHKRAQPGEYRDAHFNLESMNKQWGFHVPQKFPLAAFVHTLYSRYALRTCGTPRRLCGTCTEALWNGYWYRYLVPLNTDSMWYSCAHTHAHTHTGNLSNH